MSISIHHIQLVSKWRLFSSSCLGQKLYSLRFLSWILHTPSISKSYGFSFEIYSESFLIASTPTILLQSLHLSLGLLWKPTHLSACFHPRLPTVYSQHSHHSESLKILYHIIPLLKHSTGFPFHSKVESEVLSMAHGCVRLYVICLPTALTICLTSSTITSLPYSVSATGASLLLLVYIQHSPAQTLPSACNALPQIATRAGSLTFFRSLHRCLSLTTLSKRELSSLPIILLAFTLLLSFSSFLSLTYISLCIT